MKKYSVSSLLFGFKILHNNEAILNRLEEGPFFEVFTTFLPGLSVKCFAIAQPSCHCRSYHALLFLLIGGQCLIWRIDLGYSFRVNSASYFLLLVIQFV